MIELRNILPGILKVTDVWPDLMDAITEELTLLQTEMEKKSYYLNVDEYTDKEELLDLSRSLGYSPNLLLDDSLPFVQKEVRDIVFRIKNKSTYFYYEYVFKNINELGNIYILFKDEVKLVRAVDEEGILTILNSHDLTIPFTEFNEILHFSEYLDDLVELDAGFFLDQSPTWYLDQSIVVKTTNHLAIEYAVDELITINGTEYIITSDYLQFLSKMVDYGRKATQIPHVGAQLSLMMDESGFYNNISHGTYSIPLLKTNCSVTSQYDSSFNTVETENTQFYKAVVGIGQKTFPDYQYTGILDDLVFWYSFDNVDTTTNVIPDLADNYDGVVNGSYIEIDGISGKTLYLNGINTEIQVTNLGLNQDNHSILFWLKGDILGQSYNSARILYMNGTLNIYYDNIAKKLSCTLIGTSSSETVEYSGEIIDTEIFVSLIINTNNNTLNLYIDNQLADFADISTIGTFGNVGDLYIGSQNGSNYFKGYIDELRVYNKLIGTTTRQYLYDSKVGSLIRLANKIYEQEISPSQIFVDDDWKICYFSIPGRYITEEVIAIGDGSTYTFSGYTAYSQISDGSLTVQYTSSPTAYEITTNKQGSFIGDRVSGSVDFETGQYTLNMYKTYLQKSETVIEGATSQIIGYTTDFGNIEEESFHLYAYLGDTLYDIVDDGNGNLTGTGITSGTINYTTGELNVTFTGATDSNRDITCKYYYRLFSTPDALTEVTISYRTEQDIQIKEVGIENIDGDVVAYATFPPAQFYSVLNHMSFQFIINRTS